MAKLKQVWLCSSGLTKTFHRFLMFDVQTYTKLHDAPCNFCGFFLQNLILAVLKRPKIGIWKEIARYTVQVLRKTARCIVQFCFLTRKAALPLPQLPPSPVREAAGGRGWLLWQ